VAARSWGDYVVDRRGCPYGDVVDAWNAGGLYELNVFDSERLDESAQQARMDATVPANAAFRSILLDLALDVDQVLETRNEPFWEVPEDHFSLEDS
jgi:hypothetical protein